MRCALTHQKIVKRRHGRRDRAVGAHHGEPLPTDRHADNIEHGKPAEVIDMRVYGTMNGKAAMEQARSLLG